MNKLWIDSMYRALMSHPHDAWRAQHQWLYCALRDAIAEQTGIAPEDVQNHFAREAEAVRLAEWNSPL